MEQWGRTNGCGGRVGGGGGGALQWGGGELQQTESQRARYSPIVASVFCHLCRFGSGPKIYLSLFNFLVQISEGMQESGGKLYRINFVL